MTMIERINGHTLFFEDSAEDSLVPVVFLHGFPFNHAMWDGQVQLLKGRYRTLAYDLQGHGRSDVGDGQYTIEGHVDDLMELLDHRGIRKAVVVGLSMGGYVTLRALERHPDRFLAAVLCDTRSEGDPTEAKIKRHEQMRLVKAKGSAAFAEGFVKGVFAQASFERRPEAVALIRDIIVHTPPLSIAGTLLALAARTDTTPSLERLALPTLILVGEHDVTTPPAASRAMHEHIRGSRLQVIPDAAHMSNLENPEAFNAHLAEFLRSLPTP
jgi:3-oxoadipate enol-lactonase